MIHNIPLPTAVIYFADDDDDECRDPIKMMKSKDVPPMSQGRAIIVEDSCIQGRNAVMDVNDGRQ